MRVLYFHQHFSTPAGATGTRSYEMARRLVDRGHSVTMVCGSYSAGHTGLAQEFIHGRRTGEVDGMRVIELELPYANHHDYVRRSVVFVQFALRSIAIALREPCDVVFATSTPLTAGIPGIFARWFRRTPFVFEVRDLWPELPREMGVIKNPVVLTLMGWLEWVSYHSATHCIGLSQGMVDGIARRGISRDRITLVPNGCDLEVFRRYPGSAGRDMLPGGITDSDFVAVFTGAHGVANGLDAVLDAAVELKRRGRSDIKIVLVGEGKLKPELQDRATREQAPVVFVDPIDKLSLARLLRGVDAGLMVLANVPAFYYGTSPNKFFDYISAGLPVINNYPGWLAELIEESGCGLVVPPGDAGAFADALESLADDRDAASRMGELGRQLAEQRFARDALADQFCAVLESVAR